MGSIFHPLQTPCNPMISSESGFYAFGNTHMQDLLYDLEIEHDDLDILLLGVGDIRHVLKTVDELQRRARQPRHISFWLVDWDIGIIARDILLFEIVATIDSAKKEDVDFLWAIWYNKAISQTHANKLNAILAQLCKTPFKPSCQIVLDDTSLDKVKDIWQDWKCKVNCNVKSIQETRKQISHQYILRLFPEVQPSFYNRFVRMMASFWRQNISGNPAGKFDEKYHHAFAHEILWWVENAWTTLPTRHPDCENMTLSRTTKNGESLRHHDSILECPYYCYMPNIREHMDEIGSLTKTCIYILQQQVQQFQKFKPQIQIHMHCMDAMVFCRAGLPKDQHFDSIHTSNLVDYVGLLNILLCCVPRLKGPGSLLFTESLKWREENGTTMTVEEFLRLNVPCDHLLMPTVFGIQLAEHLDLGSTTLRTRVEFTGGISSPEALVWARAANLDISPVIQSESIRQTVANMMKQCFAVHVGVDSPPFSTPLTLLGVIMYMESRCSQSVQSLIGYVSDNLPKYRTKTGFCKPHMLTWRALVQACGESTIADSEMLNIRIRLPLEGYHNLSFSIKAFDVSLAILEDPQDVDRITPALQNSFRAPFHIVNNFSYELEKNSLLVSFFLRKKDWICLPERTIIFGYERENVCSARTRVSLIKNEACVQTISESEQPKLSRRGICKPDPAQSPPHVHCIEEQKDKYIVELKWTTTEKQIPVHPTFPDTSFPSSIQITGECDTSSGTGSVTVVFSCPIVPEEPTITWSGGHMHFTVRKDLLGSVGPSRLPLTLIDMQGLEVLFNIKKHRHAIRCMYHTEADRKFGGLSDEFTHWMKGMVKCPGKSGTKPDAFFRLRKILEGIWNGAFGKMSVQAHDVVAEKESKFTCKESGQSGSLQETLMTLIPDGCYQYRGLPFMSLTWLDYGAADCLIKSGNVTREAVKDGVSERIGMQKNRRNIIHVDWELRKLLHKLLTVNSCRLQQSASHHSKPWIKRTFIQLIFPRVSIKTSEPFMEVLLGLDVEGQAEATGIYSETAANSSGLSAKSVVSTPRCVACNATGDDLLRCTRCKLVMYCNRNCQRQDWPTHKKVCKSQKVLLDRDVEGQAKTAGIHSRSKASSSSLGAKPVVSTPRCMACNATGNGLLRCTRCNLVMYCNKNCQRRDWQNHQKVCKTQNLPLEPKAREGSHVSYGQTASKSVLTFVDAKSCAACGKKSLNLLGCTGCKLVKYCNKKCQINDWRTHREKCKSQC